MNAGLNRALTAFSGNEPDRVPVWEIGIDHPTSTEVLGQRPLWRNKLKFYELLAKGAREELVYRPMEEQIEIYEKLGLDILPVRYPVFPLKQDDGEPEWIEQLDDHSFKIDLPGGQWRILKYNEEADTMTEVDSSIKCGGLDSFRGLVEGLEGQYELKERDLDQLRCALEKSEDEFMVIGREIDVRLPFDCCWFDLFLKWMITQPDLVRRYIEANLKRTLKKIELIAETDLDGLMGGVDWAYKKGTFFSPDYFDRFIFPTLKKIVDKCHENSLLYIKHTDGNINNIIENLVSTRIDGYQAIEPRAGMDIAKLKKEFGERVTLCGNIDCSYLLSEGSEDEVRRVTRETIASAAPGGRFTLTSSNTIHSGVPPENYFAMLEEAKDYGRYPIGD